MKFKIIKENHNSKVENYHVFIEIKKINKSALLDFIDYFRKNVSIRASTSFIRAI